MAAAARTIAPQGVEARPYQEAIAQACAGQNSLVVLPTGLGKTVVAAKVMGRHLAQGERVLVLAPTRPLVDQHAVSFTSLFPGLEVARVTGTDKPDQRTDTWDRAPIVVATPQVARNDLVAGRLDPCTWGLVVVDEAHRAVGNYAAAEVAEVLRAEGVLVLGLTASPGSSAVRVKEVCQTLGIEHVEARGEWDDDVRAFVEPVTVEWVRVALPERLEATARALRTLAEDRVVALRREGVYPSRFLNRRELLQAKGRLQRRLQGPTAKAASQSLTLVTQALRLLHGITLVETQSKAAALAYLDRLGRDDPALARERGLGEARRLLEAVPGEHPKMRRAASELARHVSDGRRRALVFVQYRDTAAALTEALATVPGLEPGLFLGQRGRDGMSQREQAAQLEAFRKGGLNVLVSTSVGEEGLDIPEVDLVLFYEPVPSAIRAIQRRGRTGRHGEGRVVVLLARGTSDEAAYLTQARREREMRRLVASLNDLRPSPGPATPIRANPVSPDRGEAPRALVDHREFNGPMARQLVRAGLTVEPANLPVGDIILSNRVAVERKSARDLVASLLDGRLMEQARALKRNFEAPVLVVEGDPFQEAGGVRPEAIAGALAALTTGFGLPVITVADAGQAAAVVRAMARREHEEGRVPAMRRSSAGRTLEEQQRYLVEGLPHVSATLSSRLLAHFGSPRALFDAPEEELRKVQGIGPTTARAIREVVDSLTEWPHATSRPGRAQGPTTPSGTGAVRSVSSRSSATTS